MLKEDISLDNTCFVSVWASKEFCSFRTLQ